MPDLGTYSFYIIAAYAVAGFSLAALLLVTLYDLRVQKRGLDKFEK